jgi:exodeoxyribonuclease VII small subunit
MKKSYAQLKQELDEIIIKIQDPKVDIDEALGLHEQAKKIIIDLEKYLAGAKQKLSSK